jgi:hypothetical protein
MGMHMMGTTFQNAMRATRDCLLSIALMFLVSTTAASAGETAAKDLLNKMSNYLATQKAISFSYDADLEVVTKDKQKLLLASSGRIELGRPDKIRATRKGGFADVEVSFDGKTMTLLGKNANLYTQAEVPGTVENLIDAIRNKLGRPLPAADLLLPNVYDELMRDVTNVKDLGSGVIGGIECDHLAFAPPKSTGKYGSQRAIGPIHAATSSPPRRSNRDHSTASVYTTGRLAPM